jgi:hypothetical protein
MPEAQLEKASHVLADQSAISLHTLEYSLRPWHAV